MEHQAAQWEWHFSFLLRNKLGQAWYFLKASCLINYLNPLKTCLSSGALGQDTSESCKRSDHSTAHVQNIRAPLTVLAQKLMEEWARRWQQTLPP